MLSLAGCGYGMYYTKTITPVPSNINRLKVLEIKDVKVVTKYGEEGGKANYIRSILLADLLASKRFAVDENSNYHLILNIDGYRAGYRKYVALSTQILDTISNKVVWSAAISGVSKSYIDEVVKNVVDELVKEMSGGK
jgi:hypothetical protein